MKPVTLHNYQLSQPSLFHLVKTGQQQLKNVPQSLEYQQVITDALRVALPTVKRQIIPIEDKEIIEARQVLGEAGQHLSTSEIKDILTEVQYLTDSWLDEFERQIFKGSTLKEVLHERGKL